MRFSRFFTKEKITQLTVSVALAVLLWIVAVSSINPEIRISVPGIQITFLNTDTLSSKGLEVAPLDATVTLTLSGPSSLLSQVNKDNIRANVDLSSISGEGPFDAVVQLTGVPSNITIYGQRPEHVTLDVYKLTTRAMNYSLVNVGSPASGYALMSVSPSDTVITVKGSTFYLNDDVSIRGDLVLTSRRNDFTASVALSVYDSQGRRLDRPGIVLTPAVVSVNVEIGKSKEVPVTVRATGESPSGYFCRSVRAEPEKVRIAAKEKALESVDLIRLLDVDVSGLTESQTFTGSPVVPTGVVIVESGHFEVFVEVIEVHSEEFTFGKMQILNTPPGLLATIQKSEDIRLVLVAPPGTEIRMEDVKLYLDLAGLGEGVHAVDLRIELPKDVYIKEKSRNQMTVTLREP